MSAEKPNFLSQPVVKNVFMYRNGDPYYEARRIVINQKRVNNFETLLREVTSGIQAPFGAVRNIYTPRGGHKVDRLDSLQSGEQYVAAGRERFKKLDYLEIGPRKKRMLHALPLLAKPPPQNRINVSARFLKPIKEPCPIFVVANGDVLNPAMRLLIHQRLLGQFDKILELVTEKMGLKVLGGARSLYTSEGQQVMDGNQLESGQLYVAVGRDKFKKLPYIDLLFSKPPGMRRYNGMKAYSLPPIYRMSKQNGTGKSMVQSSDSGDSKVSPPALNGCSSKEHLSSIVREISQARLISLRKRRSGPNMSSSDQDDAEGKGTEADDLQDQTEEQGSSPNNEETAKESDSGPDPELGASEVDASKDKTKSEPAGADEKLEENGRDGSPSDVVNTVGKDEKSSVEEGSGQGQGPRDKTQDSNDKQDKGSSEGARNDQDKSAEDAEDGDSGKEANGGHDGGNDADTGEERKEQKEDGGNPEEAQARNESKEAKSSNANREEDGAGGGGDAADTGEVSREVVGGERELDTNKTDPDTEMEKKEKDK